MKRGLLILFVLSVLFINSFVYAIDVDACGTIISPGSYILTGSLSTTGDCILIDSPDVILDCNGYNISGDLGANDEAINADGGLTNITVKNCIFYNFDKSIYFDHVQNSSIINNTVYDNIGAGIFIDSFGAGIGSEFINITNNTAYNNSLAGIYLSSSNSIIVSNNTVYDNLGSGVDGITLENSNDSLITLNIIYGNNGTGVDVVSGSTNNNITNNNLYNNSNGIGFSSANSNTARNNVAYNNTYSGYLFYDSNYTNLVNNSGYVNGIFGISLDIAHYNNFTNNTLYENLITGVNLDPATNNIFTNNDVYDNLGSGFYIKDSEDNTFVDNSVYNNLDHGFLIIGSSNSIFLNNAAYNNTNNGFISSDSYSNFTSNDAYDNGAGGFVFDLQSPNSNLSLNNASNNLAVQYYFDQSNATFLDTNYAYADIDVLSLVGLSNGSVLTALVDSTYSLIESNYLNFSFANATDVSFIITTNNLTLADVESTTCSSSSYTCSLVSNVLIIENESANAYVNNLVIYYNNTALDQSEYVSSDLKVSKYFSGWINSGSSIVNSTEYSVLLNDQITTFSSWGVVGFRNIPTTSNSGGGSGSGGYTSLNIVSNTSVVSVVSALNNLQNVISLVDLKEGVVKRLDVKFDECREKRDSSNYLTVKIAPKRDIKKVNVLITRFENWENGLKSYFKQNKGRDDLSKGIKRNKIINKCGRDDRDYILSPIEDSISNQEVSTDEDQNTNIDVNNAPRLSNMVLEIIIDAISKNNGIIDIIQVAPELNVTNETIIESKDLIYTIPLFNLGITAKDLDAVNIVVYEVDEGTEVKTLVKSDWKLDDSKQNLVIMVYPAGHSYFIFLAEPKNMPVKSEVTSNLTIKEDKVLENSKKPFKLSFVLILLALIVVILLVIYIIKSKKQFYF